MYSEKVEFLKENFGKKWQNRCDYLSFFHQKNVIRFFFFLKITGAFFKPFTNTGAFFIPFTNTGAKLGSNSFGDNRKIGNQQP